MIKKAQVVIKMEGTERSIAVEPEQETILQAALDQGIDLPFSCMGGACGSCRSQLIKGEVEMDFNMVLSDEEIEDGYILACQARPLTEEVVIDISD